MKKVLTTIRCVPRLGLVGTQMRVIDIDLPEQADEQVLAEAVNGFFAQRGIADALYDISVDDDGYLAVINDEAYLNDWGMQLL